MTLTRRKLLKAAAASAAAFTIVPRHVLGGPKFVPPSEKINIALIGAGGQGMANVRQLFNEPDCQVIAFAEPFELTDLSAFYYKSIAGRGPTRKLIEDHQKRQNGARAAEHHLGVYEDYRLMLEKEKAIDAVLIAACDHIHAPATTFALRAGKHVYCEKPLTHNIWEARQVAKAARETGLATQMGNMGHSRDGIRQTCEWLWDGAIGTVREVHAWAPSGRINKTLTGRPAETPPVPAGANWNLWLGPRQPRPYHPAYCPLAWHDFWDFGSGPLGNFGCHDLDAATWALGLFTPASVEARPAGNMNEELCPHGSTVFYQFDSRAGDKPAGDDPNVVRPAAGRAFTDAPITVTWYDGGLRPPTPREFGKGELPSRGVLFIGDKGKLLAEGAGGSPRLLPVERTREYKKPAPVLARSKGHHRDWLDAIKGGRPASSNFEYGARLTEIVYLGVLALRTGKRIEWDAGAMKVKGVPEAEPMIKEEYRKGWELL